MAEKDYKFFKENSGGTLDEKTVTAETDKVLGFDINGDPQMVTAGGSSLDINSLTAKTTPVDADITVIEDSAASWAQKKVTWSNIKATLKTYFDTLYASIAQAKQVIDINDQTGTTYTLVLADAGKLVRCNNASAIALTVPPNSSVAFPVNTVITVEQKGAGQITITEGSGVNCNAFDGLLSAGQYAGLSLIKVDTDVWTVFGGISA